MGWVGYVHVGLGGLSWWVRFWHCRLGGCAKQLCEALGFEGCCFPCPFAPAVPALTFWRWSVLADRYCCCEARGGPLPACGGLMRFLPGVCGGFFCGTLASGSLVLVFWYAVVRHTASCRDLPCCVVLVLAVLRCALLDRVVWRSVVPWCAALCRVASRCAVACCALGRLVVVLCTALRCDAVCRAAPCCAVVGWWRSVRPVSWCRVRVGVWLAGGGGVRLGAGWLCFGGLGELFGLVGRLGVHGVAPPGGPVLWSCVLWGSWPLALGAVAVPSSFSGVCDVALAVAGVVAWR